MITINKGNQSTQVNQEKIANLCLELAGGGYTASQTAKAMQYQQQLLNGETIKAKGFTIKITQE